MILCHGPSTWASSALALSSWMAENAYVSWVARDRPWKLEEELIAALDLPLNLQGNLHNRFYSVRRARARCVAQARALPVPNPGIGGGRRARTPAR
jgi:GIY-YIG catalytic domain-containing protein